MIVEVDLINEIVLLVNQQLEVLHAFRADGCTRETINLPVVHYTYRSLLVLPGSCTVCGRGTDEMDQRCSSSGGFHAFAGVAEDVSIPAQHKVEQRDLVMMTLHYDELTFYVSGDNLFPIDEITETMFV